MTALSHYEQAFEKLPAPLRESRRVHLHAFLEQGFPTTREEDWRYTDLAPLAALAYEPAAAPDARPAAALEDCEALALANGRLIRGDARKHGANEAREAAPGIPTLNAAFASGGLNLDIAAGERPQPLHLLNWLGGQTQGMTHQRHRIRLGRGAQATVVLHDHGDAAAFFSTQMLDIELDGGAQLDLIRIQDLGAAASAITRTDAALGRDARFRCLSLDLGGALVRHDVNAALTQPGASAELAGVLAPSGRSHLDLHTRLDHRAPHGTSRETFRAILADRAHGVFNGKVVVHPGAQKTDSEQHVASLLLSPQAEIDAKPELEIYNDDVKCAHGATCGQLDESALYYLRSRGLTLETARNLLLFTFAHEVLGRIPLASARRLAERLLLARLPGGKALEELL
ncbi:MAG: Fe-S cluster assembly protein SufD [Gammaproteobacteria bacterium]|nr:Fe-S cluster assembly protein SufD [Gammaproteobacteria bacterium]